MNKIRIYILGSTIAALLLSSCVQPKEEKETANEHTVAQKIAHAYGIENFKDAKTLAFTFNVKRDTVIKSRSWLWDIAGNVVTYIKGKDSVTFRRDTVASASMKKIDGDFINDQYWLLFPYHLVWDSGLVVSQKEKQISPLNKKETTMFTIQYSDNVGYTPGDAYDFFIDKDYMIVEWNFRKAGAIEPTMTTTWSVPILMNGMKLSMEHENPGTNFKLYYTGVKVN
jgi:hypothetical protein